MNIINRINCDPGMSYDPSKCKQKYIGCPYGHIIEVGTIILLNCNDKKYFWCRKCHCFFSMYIPVILCNDDELMELI